MTIRKGKASEPRASGMAGEPDARPTRPKPERSGPNRARLAADRPSDRAPEGPTPELPSTDEAPEPTISEAVAHAVRTGYDVIAENIQQGRVAAQRFRQGEYNIREVPGDLETAALRLIQLARELSTTTFDVCERLLKEVGANAPAKDRATEAPPFRTAAPPASQPSTEAVAKSADAGSMKLTIRFEGRTAQAHTLTLARPRLPTAAIDITAGPLASRRAGSPPITAVKFEVDVAIEGIVALITLPVDQPPGIYSGLVHAKGDDIPLGVLTIEIPT